MHSLRAYLYPCAHCAGKGTCQNGQASESCAVCIKGNDLKGNGYSGLPCAICGGLGQAEPKTDRINKRMPAVLGYLCAYTLIIIVAFAGLVSSPYFSEILAFAGTLIGTIFGFYYSNRPNSL